MSASEIVYHGHNVVVKSVCGADIEFDDEANDSAHATVLGTSPDAFDTADMMGATICRVQNAAR